VEGRQGFTIEGGSTGAFKAARSGTFALDARTSGASAQGF